MLTAKVNYVINRKRKGIMFFQQAATTFTRLYDVTIQMTTAAPQLIASVHQLPLALCISHTWYSCTGFLTRVRSIAVLDTSEFTGLLIKLFIHNTNKCTLFIYSLISHLHVSASFRSSSRSSTPTLETDKIWKITQATSCQITVF